MEKSDRMVYLTGPWRGRPRPSRKARSRRRQRRESQAASDVERDDDGQGMAAEEETQCTGEARLKRYRLLGGIREQRDGPTQYAVEDERSRLADKPAVCLTEEEKASGRRWMRVPYPLHWMQDFTAKERACKAQRSGCEFGKEFVECDGRWHEAVCCGG